MKLYRLSQIARKLNIGKDIVVDTLAEKGIYIDNNPNSKVSSEQVDVLAEALAIELAWNEEASDLKIEGYSSPIDEVSIRIINMFDRFVDQISNISFSLDVSVPETIKPIKVPREAKDYFLGDFLGFFCQSECHNTKEKSCSSLYSKTTSLAPLGLIRNYIKREEERKERIKRYKLLIKNTIKGFRSKKRIPVIREIIKTLLPLRIFHYFTNDDESDRAAQYYSSLSVISL